MIFGYAKRRPIAIRKRKPRVVRYVSRMVYKKGQAEEDTYAKGRTRGEM